MHEKRLKIKFFGIFRKLQKKLPFARKSLVVIRKTSRAVVKAVEKGEKSLDKTFLGLTFGVTDCTNMSQREPPIQWF